MHPDSIAMCRTSANVDHMKELGLCGCTTENISSITHVGLHVYQTPENSVSIGQIHAYNHILVYNVRENLIRSMVGDA